MALEAIILNTFFNTLETGFPQVLGGMHLDTTTVACA